MFFLPLRADFTLSRLPYITILLCIFCVLVFYAQVSNWDKVTRTTQSFCAEQNDRIFDMVLEKIYQQHGEAGCVTFITHIESTQDRAATIAEVAKSMPSIASQGKEKSVQLATKRLSEKHAAFQSRAPANLTTKLAYEPESYKLATMFTATLAHADFMHLFGNLMIFLAFSASVEIALGFFRYLALYIVLAVTTAVSYSIAMSVVASPLPTIGLSGVVMGMIGTFMYLVPYARIKCFIWFFLFYRFITIPAWILAGWYVGWDTYTLLFGEAQSEINLVAHVSGACFGYLFGVLFCAQIKQRISSEMRRTRRWQTRRDTPRYQANEEY